jgi:hypothetical protein
LDSRFRYRRWREQRGGEEQAINEAIGELRGEQVWLHQGGHQQRPQQHHHCLAAICVWGQCAGGNGITHHGGNDPRLVSLDPECDTLS